MTSYTWDWFTEYYGESPEAMWWNPPCWHAKHAGNANWGVWVAQFGIDNYRYWHPKNR